MYYHKLEISFHFLNQNSLDGGVASVGAKVTGATIKPWLLNKFISFLAVLGWKSDILRQGLYEKQMHIFSLWRKHVQRFKMTGIKLYEELCS